MSLGQIAQIALGKQEHFLKKKRFLSRLLLWLLLEFCTISIYLSIIGQWTHHERMQFF